MILKLKYLISLKIDNEKRWFNTLYEFVDRQKIKISIHVCT